MINKKLKTLVISLGFISSFLLGRNALAEQRNVVSSCRIHTTAGETKGKCIIRTYIDGDYIMIQVVPSWFKSPDDGPTLLRVMNNPSCTHWSGFDENGCKGELLYGTDDSNDWGYASVTASEGRFSYGIGGSGFALWYDGPLPRPSN